MDKLNRFTSKYPDTISVYYKYYLNGYHYEQGEFIEKLGQLEDIEEELGVNLITLFKALKNGLYYRFYNNAKISKMKVPMLRIIDGEYCWICPKWMTATWMNVKIKDYGKTWALTIEELEE